MSSNAASDAPWWLDLESAVPTTPADIEALRRVKRDTPTWLLLTPAEIDALLPSDALDRRSVTAASATPFELP